MKNLIKNKNRIKRRFYKRNEVLSFPHIIILLFFYYSCLTKKKKKENMQCSLPLSLGLDFTLSKLYTSITKLLAASDVLDCRMLLVIKSHVDFLWQSIEGAKGRHPTTPETTLLLGVWLGIISGGIRGKFRLSLTSISLFFSLLLLFSLFLIKNYLPSLFFKIRPA